jgi:dihydroanticapsin dehydrogenase
MIRSTRGVVAVTGAAGGIGEAIAKQFAELGSSVVLVDWNAELLAATTSRLADEGATVSALVADVSDADDARRIVEEAVGRYGGLDILCNNAAVTVPKPVHELEELEWDAVLGVNLKAIFLTSKNAVSRMRDRGGGVIVNVASVDAYVAERNIPAYCAAKGGVLNLTRALALDYAADNIRVNCVCPGMTDTPLFRSFMAQVPDPDEALRQRLQRVPLGRLVQPAEVAAAVLFLASDQASAITGAMLTVDAGLTAGWDYSPT